MLRRAERALLAAGLAAMLVLTGCSGSGRGVPSGQSTPTPVPTPEHLDLSQWDREQDNGITLLGGPDARAVVLAAMRAAGSSSMQGAFVATDGSRLAVEVHSSRSNAVARFTLDGATTTLVRLDGEAFLSPSPALGAQEGLEADAYTCLGIGDPLVTRWSPLSHPRDAVAALTEDAVSLGQPADGQVDLILGSEGTLGTLTLDAEGAPLPTMLTRADAAGVMTLTFDGWGEDVEFPAESELRAAC